MNLLEHLTVETHRLHTLLAAEAAHYLVTDPDREGGVVTVEASMGEEPQSIHLTEPERRLAMVFTTTNAADSYNPLNQFFDNDEIGFTPLAIVETVMDRAVMGVKRYSDTEWNPISLSQPVNVLSKYGDVTHTMSLADCPCGVAGNLLSLLTQGRPWRDYNNVPTEETVHRMMLNWNEKIRFESE